LPGYVEAKLTLTEVRSDGRLQDLNLERKEGDVKLDYEKGLKSEALEGVYGPGITKETKSEATMVFTSDLNTSTECIES
jgi:hypothetical protein